MAAGDLIAGLAQAELDLESSLQGRWQPQAKLRDSFREARPELTTDTEKIMQRQVAVGVGWRRALESDSPRSTA